MSADGEMEREAQRRGWTRRAVAHGSRRFVVQRRLVEGTDERAAFDVAQRGKVEPEHMKDGSAHRRDGPLPAEAVLDQERRLGASAIVPRDNIIARFGQSRPSVEVVACPGEAIPRLEPPRRGGRADRRERQGFVSRHRGPAVRDLELHGGHLIHHRDREAVRIEAKLAKDERGAASKLVLRMRARLQRIHQRGELPAPFARDSRGDGVGKEIANADRPARAEVQNPSPRRVPCFGTGLGHVDMVFI